jgi:putative phosphoribosyl transferase
MTEHSRVARARARAVKVDPIKIDTIDLPLEPTIFDNRRVAGQQLAASLQHLKNARPIVLALPRGGVPVGAEVANALSAPLEIILVRKIRAPGQPELGLGAVVDGPSPELVLNDDIMESVRPDPIHIASEKARQLLEIEKRRWLYRTGRAAQNVTGRTVIVVDDGIATGGTVRAVLLAMRRADAARVVLAVPVAPPEVVDSLRAEADEIIVLSQPKEFGSVGQHYRDFAQVSDPEVIDILRKAAATERSVEIPLTSTLLRRR